MKIVKTVVLSVNLPLLFVDVFSGYSTLVASGAEACTSLVNSAPLNSDTTLYYVSTDSTLTAQLVRTHDSSSKAWIALGVSSNGQMIGSNAIVGLPGTDSVEKYYLGGKSVSSVTSLPSDQTLTNTSIVQNDTHTVLTFTTLLEDTSGGISLNAHGSNTFLWAVGSSNDFNVHKNKDSFTLTLSPCDPSDPNSNESVGSVNASPLETPYGKTYKAHGVLATLAWALFTPIAITASVARSLCLCGHKNNQLWFKIHKLCNMATFLFTVVAFSLAVHASKQLGSTASAFKEKHPAIGLSIFIIVTLQVIGGIFRPPKLSPVSASKNDTEPPQSHKESESSVVYGGQIEVDDETTPGYGGYNGGDNDEEIMEVVSKKRLLWCWGHRIIGLTLLGLALYQIHLGFEIYNQKYEQDNKNIKLYLGWIGILGAVCIGTIVFTKIRT